MSYTPSFLYSNRTLYHLALRLLYGRYFEARYAAIAAEIPPGSQVVDVCAGDCYLYLKHLRQKSVSYLGLDISPQLVQWAQRRGVLAREFNVWQDEIPMAEIAVMQASLYQFLPHAEDIVRRLLAAAHQKAIVSEPVRNLSACENSLLVMFARSLTAPILDPGTYVGQRFNARSLTELFGSFEAFERSFFIPGGREMVGIFCGQFRSYRTACSRVQRPHKRQL